MRKRSPVACNADQTNVPCIYKKASQCLLRTSNCTHKPCTEGAHQPIACDKAIPALAKRPTRVCLDVTGMVDQTMIRVFQEDSASHTSYGPSPRANVRMCADGADRPWRIEVDDRNVTKLEGALDWSKGGCATLDLAAGTVKMGCAEPFSGNPIEGRL